MKNMSYDEDGNRQRKPHGLSKAEIRKVSVKIDLKVILIKSNYLKINFCSATSQSWRNGDELGLTTAWMNLSR